VTPTCCRDSIIRQTIRLYVEDGARPERAFWCAASYETLNDAWDVKAKFCPFCGAHLPQMRRKANPPKPLCVIEDGGNYCSTCSKRLNCCRCRPPADAFEPEAS
jgi:hypothetical protein